MAEISNVACFLVQINSQDEGAYGISYWWSIRTELQSLTVFEIFSHNTCQSDLYAGEIHLVDVGQHLRDLIAVLQDGTRRLSQVVQ